MQNRANVFMTVLALVSLLAGSAFAMTPYVQDFESLSQGSATALSDAGWLVFGNVFGLDWAFWYGYGVFPAPNGTGAFCDVVIGEGGPGQEFQQMAVYSDYNSPDHPVAWIEANVFNEQTVAAGDVGQTWTFNFDAKKGNLEGNTTAIAFIKTLNPMAGYATTNFITLDMTSAPTTWGSYSISIAIDGTLVGQILQIGFSSTATNYQGSGVFYDNVAFSPDNVVSTEVESFGNVKALFR